MTPNVEAYSNEQTLLGCSFPCSRELMMPTTAAADEAGLVMLGEKGLAAAARKSSYSHTQHLPQSLCVCTRVLSCGAR
jgi:hypothetical protein